MYTLRAATADDTDFLVDVVIEATREQGRESPGFDEAKFRAGFAAWTARPAGGSSTYVIEVDGGPVGRLRVVRTGEEVDLAGIQLLPAYQSRGIGTRIVADLVAEAAAAGHAVTLSVEKDNPRARAFYLRLGFAVTGETADEYLMRR